MISSVTSRWVLSLLVLITCSSAFGQVQNLTLPPPRPPVGCTTNVLAVAGVAGSPAYVRLRYALEAFSAAQNAVQEMGKDLDHITDSVGLEAMLSGMISSTQIAIDGLRCSAYIWGTFKPKDKDDALVRKAMIKAFNMEADAIGHQLRLAKSRTLAGTHKSPSALLKEAEEDSAIEQQQLEAADQLLQMSNFLIMRSVDISDRSAQHIEYLTISCSEETELVGIAQGLLQGEETAYSDPARLIADGLPKLKCR